MPDRPALPWIKSLAASRDRVRLIPATSDRLPTYSLGLVALTADARWNDRLDDGLNPMLSTFAATCLGG